MTYHIAPETRAELNRALARSLANHACGKTILAAHQAQDLIGRMVRAGLLTRGDVEAAAAEVRDGEW
jgi:hypothetical protein